jgi:hypothetical protein
MTVSEREAVKVILAENLLTCLGELGGNFERKAIGFL